MQRAQITTIRVGRDMGNNRRTISQYLKNPLTRLEELLGALASSSKGKTSGCGLIASLVLTAAARPSFSFCILII